MSVEASITLLTSLMSIGVVILLAAIPWAYGIHGRLTKMETNLQNVLRHADSLDRLRERVTRIELLSEPKHVGDQSCA